MALANPPKSDLPYFSVVKTIVRDRQMRPREERLRERQGYAVFGAFEIILG